jgi:glyceraldehyde 3-phosphate dehydrogenase/glyceraldehyde-3-phosphate dehydrogenase (NAD(P))
MKRIAINGMGRTGRVMLRKLLTEPRGDLELVAVNDIADPADVAYLVKYDSVFGRLGADVRYADGMLEVGDRGVRLLRHADPLKLPWRDLGVEVVIESTGQFTERHEAAKHLTAGARRVLVGAPSPDADFTLVLGVNHEGFDPGRHFVVSNASCTTNSLAPPLKVLLDAFGIDEVAATTVHAYTASQGIVDKPAKKKHRGRAAAVSMIPTSTGADSATAQVLPALAGRIKVSAIRVPVPDGSVTDISVRLARKATAADVNGALREASRGALAGILGYSEEELVSIDIIGEPHSGIVHANATAVAGQLAKVLVWYDNEYGYACRCLDVVSRLEF